MTAAEKIVSYALSFAEADKARKAMDAACKAHRGEFCKGSAEWVNQRLAFEQRRIARKYAGIRRSVLTRMCNKVNAEGRE